MKFGVMRPLVPLLAVLFACEHKPRDYGECLLDLGRSRPADEAERLCKQAFPEPEPKDPIFAGQWFYETTGNQCASISFDRSGRIIPEDAGFCGGMSRVECDGDDCRFTCSSYNTADSSVVFAMEDLSLGLARFNLSDPNDLRLLYKRLADCEEGRAFKDPLPSADSLKIRLAFKKLFPSAWDSIEKARVGSSETENPYSEFLEGLDPVSRYQLEYGPDTVRKAIEDSIFSAIWDSIEVDTVNPLDGYTSEWRTSPDTSQRTPLR